MGNYCLNLEDFKGGEERSKEDKAENHVFAQSKFFKGEILEGQRKPKMMESFGFGTDPDAGKFLRLEL